MTFGKKLAGLMALLAVSGHAWADGTWIDCVRTSGYYQFFNTATIEVGKDAAVRDLLGTWQTSPGPNVWTCTPRANSQGATIEMTVAGASPYANQGYNLDVDGQSYRVYNTVVKTGLGYIARWRYTINGQTSDWTPLTAVSGQQLPSERITLSGITTSFTISTEVQMRYVKTDNALSAGSPSLFDPIYMRHFQTNGSSTFYGDGTYMIAQVKSGGLNISTNTGTCTTPNVTVTLPEASTSDFSGPGYTTARKDFTLNFNKCPAGLGSISYTFTPTTAILDSANGVVALDSGSTARGVGIQLLTDNNVPVTYNSAYLLKDYDATLKDANYTVPMTAGLYQTEATVTPGEANSAVSFTLSYK